jgi:hypothetical protein
MNIYFAAPYDDAPLVQRLHTRAKTMGLKPMSHWAETAHGSEQLATMPIERVRSIAWDNDVDLKSSQVVIVLAREGAGGEMFAEARLALTHEIPVIWVGDRRPLTAYRPGVIRVGGIEEAFVVLKGLSDAASAPWIDGPEWTRSHLWEATEFFNGDEEIAEREARPPAPIVVTVLAVFGRDPDDDRSAA